MDRDFIETVVYLDNDYPSRWIDNRAGYPDKIAQYLHNKGLELKE